MRHSNIPSEDYLEVGQVFHQAYARHYAAWFTGTWRRHKRTEQILPRLVKQGKLRRLRWGKAYVYAVPRISRGTKKNIAHAIACTEAEVRCKRGDLSGQVIPEKAFRGLGVVPEWGIRYPKRQTLLLFEYCSRDNFSRARLVESKLTRYRLMLEPIEQLYEARAVVLFVIDVAREKVVSLVQRLQPEAWFYFTDYDTFLTVPLGWQLIAPIYLQWNGKEADAYPLRPDEHQIYP